MVKEEEAGEEEEEEQEEEEEAKTRKIEEWEELERNNFWNIYPIPNSEIPSAPDTPILRTDQWMVYEAIDTSNHWAKK